MGNPETSGGLTATTPFGYAGGYTDPTGLIDLINRYYDPTTGQFISVDPIDSLTAKPYAYADGNPINNNDPLGLATYFRCYDYSYTWGGTGKKTWGYRYAGCTWALGEYGTHLLVDLMNWIGTLLSLCAGLSLIADVLDVGATTPLTIACTVGGALSFYYAQTIEAIDALGGNHGIAGGFTFARRWWHWWGRLVRGIWVLEDEWISYQ